MKKKKKKKKKNKNTRDDCLRMSILSEYNARETRCTGKFCPSRVILITRGRRKKLLLVLRLDLRNSVILLLTGPSSAFKKMYGHGTS